SVVQRALRPADPGSRPAAARSRRALRAPAGPQWPQLAHARLGEDGRPWWFQDHLHPRLDWPAAAPRAFRWRPPEQRFGDARRPGLVERLKMSGRPVKGRPLVRFGLGLRYAAASTGVAATPMWRRESSRRISSSASTRPRIANPAPVKKAALNPSVSACLTA